MIRFLKHYFFGNYFVKKYFPKSSLSNISLVISDSEKRHSGELVFAVEASLPLQKLIQGVNSRQRAIEKFSELKIWDTEGNSGVLIYLLLADRKMEIIADRGIAKKVDPSEWQMIISRMEGLFRNQNFEKGVILAIAEITELLAKHFPALPDNPNELPNEPVIVV